MKEKREIHLAVTNSQLIELERTLIERASSVLELKKARSTSSAFSQAVLDEAYNNITNLLHQTKRERKRIANDLYKIRRF